MDRGDPRVVRIDKGSLHGSIAVIERFTLGVAIVRPRPSAWASTAMPRKNCTRRCRVPTLPTITRRDFP